MTQLSLVAYLAGGAFLSLAYFDLPYYLMILVVAARLWVGRRAKLNEGPVPTWQAKLGWGEAIDAQKAAK
jgi:hypothetical protein